MHEQKLPKIPTRTALDRTAPAASKHESEAAWDERERQRNQRLNIAEGGLYAISMGLTASFIVPFALVLGSSSTLIALITTLPNLLGAFAQLWVQKVRSFFDTRRRHMFTFAFIQALSWLPLLAIPHLPHPGWWLLAIITVNSAASFLIGPVWNGFTADIVPESQRGRFFGVRNTITGIGAFVSTLLAGLLLQWLKPTHPLLGFSTLFLLAFGFRLCGALMFTRMGKPPEATAAPGLPAPHKLLLEANRTPFGRFTLFLTLFYITVYLASPFFAVYQLSILQWSYLRFTLFACISAITSFLTMFVWGRFVDRVGARIVLLISGLLVPIIPLIWAATTDVRILVFAEILSGLAWAGFGLSVSTYLFDSTDRATRTRQVAEYTLLIQLAMFLGAVLGGWMLGHYGKSADAFIHIFFLSAALRFVIVLAFIGVITELRLLQVPVQGRLFRRFVAIRPTHGVVYETAVESHPSELAKQSPKEVRDRIVSAVKRAKSRR